jgi:hypothetical protein
MPPLFVHEDVFVQHNQGKDYFGPHNIDELGHTTVPITVKITEKRLDCKRSHSETEG